VIVVAGLHGIVQQRINYDLNFLFCDEIIFNVNLDLDAY
jgi:hypothetical protein